MRMTRACVEGKIRTVNTLLGVDPDVPYPFVGQVVLYGAYDMWGVHRVVNDAGGQSDLMGGLGTMREVGRFLDGMIQALRIANPDA